MLEVSTATSFITPDEPCLMGGYGNRKGKSTGVLDELKCTALALSIDGETAALCNVELLMVPGDMVERIKARLHRECGVKPEFIRIAATHTHAGPEIRSDRLRIFDEGADDGFWLRYSEFLENRIYETIRKCFEKGFDKAEASARTVTVEGYYGNRNGKGKPEDKAVSMIRFTGADGRVLAGAVNLACHPTVLGQENYQISGDLFGFLSRDIQKHWGVYPLMMQGASGDMSNRNYRLGHDEAELFRTGDGILAQLFPDEGYQSIELAAPVSLPYTYAYKYDLDIPLFESHRARNMRLLEQAEDYDVRKMLQSGIFAIDMKLRQPHIKGSFHASALRMGDLEICCVPGEMFARFGMQVKAASRAKLPILWGYVDDYGGYMSDESEYGVTYESLMSPLPKGGAEEITAGLCKLVAG